MMLLRIEDRVLGSDLFPNLAGIKSNASGGILTGAAAPVFLFGKKCGKMV